MLIKCVGKRKAITAKYSMILYYSMSVSRSKMQIQFRTVLLYPSLEYFYIVN